ncbi:MAG: hypothetical protein RIA65_10365 [Woeseia sp.]
MKTPTLIALLALLLPAVTFAQSDETDATRAERQLAEAAAAEYRKLQQDAPLTAPTPESAIDSPDAQSGVQHPGRRLSVLKARLQETEQRRIRDRYQLARLALIEKLNTPDTVINNVSQQTMSAATGK